MEYKKIYGECGGCGNYRMWEDEKEQCPYCQFDHIYPIEDDINIAFFDNATDKGEELPRIIIKPEEEQESEEPISEYLEERKILSKERSELKDSDFGLPDERKYPLIDKERIRKAIQFFKYCPPDNKKELGKNIVKKVKELKLEDEIHVSKNNPYKKYFPELVAESAYSINSYDNLSDTVESAILNVDVGELLNIYESLDYIDESGMEEKLYTSLYQYYSNIQEVTIEEAGRLLREEHVTSEKMKPVFISLTGGTKLFSKAVKKITKSEYSHAGISLDMNFDRIYAFNDPGLVIENLKEYKNIDRYAIYMLLVPVTTYRRIEYFIKNLFMGNQDRYKYNNFVVAIPLRLSLKASDFKFFCSEFVDYVLKISGVDLTGKKSTMVTPQDFTQSKRLILVDKGTKSEINIPSIKKKIKNFLAQYDGKVLQEMKNTIEIKTDSDGMFIIKKKENVDFMNFYSRSHRLLLEYEKVNNLRAIKYELAKLWFMNVIIERKIIYRNFKFATKKHIDDAKNARAFILNDFTKYLRFVLSKEPNFNFQEYYDKTEFGVETYKIDKNAIILLADVIKKIITGGAI